MRATTLVFCLLTATCTLVAQENDRTNGKTKVIESPETVQVPVHYYRLNFVIEELGTDGKPTNSRTYSSVVSTDPTEQERGTIRTGSRIPIVTGALHGSTGDGKLEFQYQYLDVG